MKPECDKPLSNVAFKFNLRPYKEGTSDTGGAGAGAGAGGWDRHKFKVLQVTVQEDFTEGAALAGHEEGGLVNNFKSNDIFKNYGEVDPDQTSSS